MINKAWQRLTYNGKPVYINPTRPDWLVPGPEADQRLRKLADQRGLAPRDRILLEQFSQDLKESPYPGRAQLLTLDRLNECWFHLTDSCNLSCRHCLFNCSPAGGRQLDPDLLRRGLTEAASLGCRLFYFTGGEPFMYRGFTSVLAELLAEPKNHAVILTNGLLLSGYLTELGSLPGKQLHLQISLDGLEEQHDAIRGKGTFQELLRILKVLQAGNYPVTLSVAVNRINLHDLPRIARLAGDFGVKNIHLLWHFIRGKGSPEQFVQPDEIFPHLREAHGIAMARGIAIDNIETIRGQVFSSPGTRFDLSNTAWESLAIGPDGQVYPSPALVGEESLQCGPLKKGLETVWRHSPVLERIRSTSLIDSPRTAERPLRFLVGGGDLDHSFVNSGNFSGSDPYLELHEQIALWLITEQAENYITCNHDEIILRMGDVRHDCPDGGSPVSLTHCNCVISLADDQEQQVVREFYGRAARETNEEIINPFAPQGNLLDIVPDKSKKRSYGCGSPVRDADLRAGETLVDLGSGSGVECFLAAAEVGASGRVYGIDMTHDMLELARSSQQEVAGRLGYDNIEFLHGFLEKIPLPDGCADVVISNCVINLSPDKRRTFSEIFRILKPGGRLIISDIVTDVPIPVTIKNNDKYRGECLGGAFQQKHLLAMLRATGFGQALLVKRFPYRLIGQTSFYSLTYRCLRPPTDDEEVTAMYRGPLAAVVLEDGSLAVRGETRAILPDDGSFFVINEAGEVVGGCGRNDCCSGPAAAESCCPQPAGDDKTSPEIITDLRLQADHPGVA